MKLMKEGKEDEAQKLMRRTGTRTDEMQDSVKDVS